MPNLFNSSFRLLIESLWRQDNCGITGVNTCIFNVLRDDEDFDLAMLSHSIQFDLFDFPEEFCDRDGMFRRDCCRLPDIVLQFFLGIADVHCTAGEHIGWPDKHRKTHTLGKSGQFCQVGKTVPFWLADIERV